MRILITLWFLALTAVDAAALSGREVIEAAQQQHGFSTWKDRSLFAKMASYDGTVVTREREIEVEEATDPRGDHKTFIEFVSPTDVQGTLFLHLSPRGKRDEQWMWTRTTQRVRRLAEAQQDENFFGSDLSYRDLELIVRIQQWSDAEAAATLEPAEETVDGHACQVVELQPASQAEFPNYKRYRLWFGSSDRLLWRVDIHDLDDKVIKRVTMQKYATIGRYATATDAEVANPPAGTHTAFAMHDFKYDQGVAETAFSLSRLSKGQ